VTDTNDQSTEAQKPAVQLQIRNSGLSELPRIGILGAGRLGKAVANRWREVNGEKPLLWSRRYGKADPSPPLGKDEDSFSVNPIEMIMERDAVYAAIPSNGVVELASSNRALKDYAGVLFIAGIDLPLGTIQQCMPAAYIVRVAPFLLPARKDVPSLVLASENGEAVRDARATVILGSLGPVDRIDDEKIFELLLYFGSPFAVVLRRSLREMIASIFVDQNIQAEWQGVAETVLWEALTAMKPERNDEEVGAAEAEVATPGGITEAGLGKSKQLSEALADTILAMIRRKEQLRSKNR
jgi:pyrroline-5-carboxylate reductase